jgi:ATP-dependent Lhr-like helicase
VLITPESIEAMLANRAYAAKALFSETKFVIIDEIHSFIGTDRGVHLMSLLSRLQALNQNAFRLIGLSATIGDYQEAKGFTGDVEKTTVLLDRTAKELQSSFRYFDQEGSELPLELLKDLYRYTRDGKVLIFPNTRGRTEEVAVKLKKIAERVGGHQNYFSHHSSVDKDVREYVEFFAKTSGRENFAISCTSTLELGIDIGMVDAVVQIDATARVSSLIQRAGRSGRRGDRPAQLRVYSTNEWSLLQSLACWTLYRDEIIEHPEVVQRPYDILLHQLLSVTKGSSGMDVEVLINELRGNYAFAAISAAEIRELIHHLLSIDLLERIRNEVIIGVEGESIVNNRNFYSVFETESALTVSTGGKRIGELPYSPQVVVGEKLFLAARVWKIVDVDFRSRTVEVVAAPQGKAPRFSGGQPGVHSLIRERMLSILFSTEDYEVLDDASREALRNLRKEFSMFPLKDLSTDRPLAVGTNKDTFFTFVGSRISASLRFLLKMAGISATDHGHGVLELGEHLEDLDLSRFTADDASIDVQISEELQNTPALASFSKWSTHLPEKFQISLLREKYFDFAGATDFLRRCRLIKGSSTGNA